jgi:hypothetical protein
MSGYDPYNHVGKDFMTGSKSLSSSFAEATPRQERCRSEMTANVGLQQAAAKPSALNK